MAMFRDDPPPRKAHRKSSRILNRRQENYLLRLAGLGSVLYGIFNFGLAWYDPARGWLAVALGIVAFVVALRR